MENARVGHLVSTHDAAIPTQRRVGPVAGCSRHATSAPAGNNREQHDRAPKLGTLRPPCFADVMFRKAKPEASPRGPLIGIVAGEASGDALGATLIRAMRRRHPHVRFAGIAGPRMQAEGCESWYPLEQLAVRGLVEVLRHIPELWRLRRGLYKRLLRERVPLFIGVDAPDFNLGLEAKLKRRGVRTVHFVSPQVWAWRAERIAGIGRATHRVLALFPFETGLYDEARVPVTYVGHPLAASAATAATRREMRGRFLLRPATPVFALLPGSRLSEIDMHAETVLRTAALIHDARPDAQFLVPLVTRATRERFDEFRYRLDLAALPISMLYGHAEEALRVADVALVSSGTATLQAALARCPHVIFYRVTRLTAWILRRKLTLPWVGLPNVLAGRFIVPEFLQDDATPRNLAQATLNLYDDAVTRKKLEAVFGDLSKSLCVDTGELAADALTNELRAAKVAV
ncbi:MAG TPA: lipid-A-disaccharide synthase [Casimicrobiaceae bacterium]|nr:lipid-A-disaccharide synthase [Casimicrobiaceae bacterium]